MSEMQWKTEIPLRFTVQVGPRKFLFKDMLVSFRIAKNIILRECRYYEIMWALEQEYTDYVVRGDAQS